MTAPAEQRGRTLALTAMGLACASASALAFFLHVLGWVQMPFFISFVGLPAILLMVILGLYSWNRRLPFGRRCRAGLIAGLTGLLAYDLVRYTVYRSRLLDYDPFHAIALLGALITARPATSEAAVFAGWLYHFWNGLSFAMIYALAVGPARWQWGIAWAMILEVGMLLSYPSVLAIRASGPFVGISLIGHLAYGAALGLTVQRWARPEPPR